MRFGHFSPEKIDRFLATFIRKRSLETSNHSDHIYDNKASFIRNAAIFLGFDHFGIDPTTKKDILLDAFKFANDKKL
jgi:hypothetical protein